MNNEYCISAILIKGYCLIYRTGANLACWPPANKHHAFNGEAMLHLLHFQSDRYSYHTFNKEVLHLLDVQVPHLQGGCSTTTYTCRYHTLNREVLHLLDVQVPHLQQGGAPPPPRTGTTPSTGRCLASYTYRYCLFLVSFYKEAVHSITPQIGR